MKVFTPKPILRILVLGCFACGSPAVADGPWRQVANAAAETFHRATETTQVVNHNGQIELGFSPGEGAEKLVIKTIDSAREEIRVLAYSFTSATVVDALLRAKHRGVDVRVVADEKHNLRESDGKAAHALAALRNAGVPVRTVSQWAAQHSKTIVADRRHVQTGSFNYSAAAASRNSENVIVVWNNPGMAATYLQHWESRFARGRDFAQNY